MSTASPDSKSAVAEVRAALHARSGRPYFSRRQTDTPDGFRAFCREGLERDIESLWAMRFGNCDGPFSFDLNDKDIADLAKAITLLRSVMKAAKVLPPPADVRPIRPGLKLVVSKKSSERATGGGPAISTHSAT